MKTTISKNDIRSYTRSLREDYQVLGSVPEIPRCLAKTVPQIKNSIHKLMSSSVNIKTIQGDWIPLQNIGKPAIGQFGIMMGIIEEIPTPLLMSTLIDLGLTGDEIQHSIRNVRNFLDDSIAFMNHMKTFYNNPLAEAIRN